MATTLPDDIFLAEASPAAVGISVTVAVVTCPPMVWTCWVVIGVVIEPTADSCSSLAMPGENAIEQWCGKVQRSLTLEDDEDDADEDELADRLDVCRFSLKHDATSGRQPNT
jgi:hypothetical protein